MSQAAGPRGSVSRASFVGGADPLAMPGAFLNALAARLQFEDDGRNGDGYFVRLKDDSRLGPMTGRTPTRTH